tara:strand:- start:181 stop:801 length:621 start_codon:yes stop_codon:yes gene_type:complete
MADTNNRVFNAMKTVSADNTRAELFPQEIDKSTKGIHNALMAAGMTPALGNVADLADATLYALEGEFGNAAWSAAAAIPVIGQMVSGKKALKAAKESGERIFTVYRTAEKWHPGKMVRDGKFTGSLPHEIYTTLRKDVVENYRKGMVKYNKKKDISPITLEFELPESWLRRNMKEMLKEGWDKGKMHEFHTNPIPKEFLKKVHKDG